MEIYLPKLSLATCYVFLLLVGRVSCGGPSPPPARLQLQLHDTGCIVVDELCLVPEEVPNYEAIKSLHSQLDDDRSGDIDVAESVDFLKEELQYAKGYEKRQKVFHYNNDEYISVHELWYIWKKSEVHNWTVDQTVAWLVESVELKQYAQNFYENAVNGSSLPRLAANNEQFLTKVLGIKDPKHRSKITIKAMDVVLFGPPKDTGSHLKDLVLVSLLTLALIGCFKAYQRNREYEGQLSEMLKDMEKLREAEENLHQLEVIMTTKAKNNETNTAKVDEKNYDDEVQQLRLQLEEEREKNEIMKEQMKRGLEELESEDSNWRAPIDLQHWLQLTYEREKIAFEKKYLAAQEQFSQAKEMCDKLNRQRRSLMGILVSVHGKMDNVDQAISQARTTMEEVTHELRERDQRWKHIEILAGCPITNNAGVHALELMLRPQVNGRQSSTYGSSIGATSYYAGSSLSSPGLVKTPGGSMADVQSNSGSGSTRKKSQLIPRDSGSSLASESSVTQLCLMHHSHTYSSDLAHQTLNENCIRRVSSAGSISHILEQDQSKDLQDSSAEETDASICATDGNSFSMGGSRLTLNSESRRAVSPSQVSLSTSPPPSMHHLGSNEGEKELKPSPKRSPMLKSYSQDTGVGSRSEAKLKEKEKISASEPALDSSKIQTEQVKKVTSLTEGNSSHTSLIEDRTDIGKKTSKGMFNNKSFLGSLKLKTKKQKHLEKNVQRKTSAV